jgi:hypothetical protein
LQILGMAGPGTRGFGVCAGLVCAGLVCANPGVYGTGVSGHRKRGRVGPFIMLIPGTPLWCAVFFSAGGAFLSSRRIPGQEAL